MNGFLYQIADQLQEAYGEDMSRVTVIFPNQRAGLYLRQILKERSGDPVWAPDIISFREFIQRESQLTVPDSLYLTFELFKTYRKVLPGTESFEDFYFWGQMLLRDFDELDKYLIPAKHLYRDLSRQKELDMTFDFLSSEQKDLVREFWSGFEDRHSESQVQFLQVWNRLFDVYEQYLTNLRKDGYTYEGSMYRELAEKIENHEWKRLNDCVWFAGFNALTRAEEVIIRHILEEKKEARVFWDLDASYVEDQRQEAGNFLRQFRRDELFGKTFPAELPDRLRQKGKTVEIVGVPQYVGQAKICSQYLEQVLESATDLRRIALVLADETLLLPVLHSLPESVGAINITMGFPLIYAPLTGLIEQIAELQLFSRMIDGKLNFHSRYISRIENHPVVAPFVPAGRPWVEKREQRLYWDSELLNCSELYSLIFVDPGEDFVSYLTRILEELSVLVGSEDSMTAAHLHYYLKHLYRYSELIEGNISTDTFRRLFRQLARMDKIPFTGEPLEGLQIMGVLETRNLDFEHIFVLGMNEESFPGGKNKHSYIPYNLRKAYGLPHYDQQDAIYAYLFYRLLHNSSTVTCFYNTEGDQLGGEEMSRFLKQLIYEKPLEVNHQLLQNMASISESPEITTVQDEQTLRQLHSKYLDPEATTRISPSAVNAYLDCSLKFYFKYVAGLYEQEELEDNVDYRTLGNLIHYSVEQLYLPFLHKEVSANDVTGLMKEIPDAVTRAFRKMYHIEEGESFRPEGKNIIAAGVVEKYLRKILEKDRDYAPFTVSGLEVLIDSTVSLPDGRKIRCGGYVDRIDRKGDKVRIVDFKSGSDSARFKGVESLFDGDSKTRNKAAFQTFFYASLYYPDEVGLDIVPVVYNRNVLFQDGDEHFFDADIEHPVARYEPYREDYGRRLTALLEEIFSPDTTFPQTENLDKCRICPYNTICQRA